MSQETQDYIDNATHSQFQAILGGSYTLDYLPSRSIRLESSHLDDYTPPATPEPFSRKHNRISSQVRCCYANDVKSAKEFKISLKDEHASFFPTIAYSLLEESENKLDLRTKRPYNLGGLGQIANPLLNEEECQALYRNELDKWFLNNQATFEQSQVHRGVCRVLAIFVQEGQEEEKRLKFRLQAATGFVIKLGDSRVLVTVLSVLQNQMHYMHGVKPILMAAFGNRDLLPYIYAYLRKCKGNQTRKQIKAILLEKHFRVLTRVRLSSTGLKARKEWLISNSRGSEILDSEFYYQVFPSLDMAVLHLCDDSFLQERAIRPLEYNKYDHRYKNTASVGFSLPLETEYAAWKRRFGCSKGLPRNEMLMVATNKTLSLGKVMSYGAVTSIQNCVAQGAQGSPVINDLGRCWGFIINCYDDMAAKGSERVEEKEDKKSKKMKKKGSKKKQKKREEKEKRKKEEKELKIEEQKQEALKKYYEEEKSEYFDIKSEHSLIPLLPMSNSYNRNFVLTFNHHGVRYILDKVSQELDDSQKVQAIRHEIIQKQQIEDVAPETTSINPCLVKQAKQIGDRGFQMSKHLYDHLREEQERKKEIKTFSSEGPKVEESKKK